MTEAQPQPQPDWLPPTVMNPITIELITASGIDPLKWAEKYAARVRIMVEGDAALRELAKKDPSGAAREVRKRLDEETGATH